MKVFTYVLGAVGTVATAGLIAVGVFGLPPPGAIITEYAEVATRVLVEERHVANAVSGVLIDLRPLDTLFEEIVLFASVIGLAVLVREDEDQEPWDEPSSIGLRLACAGLAPFVLVLGLEIATWGHVSPGGGFQGGIVISSVFLLAYFAGRVRAFQSTTAEKPMDVIEAAGVLALLSVGLIGLTVGALYSSWLPPGELHDLFSAGIVPAGNLAATVAVAVGATLVIADFATQLRKKRREEREPG